MRLWWWWRWTGATIVLRVKCSLQRTTTTLTHYQPRVRSEVSPGTRSLVRSTLVLSSGVLLCSIPTYSVHSQLGGLSSLGGYRKWTHWVQDIGKGKRTAGKRRRRSPDPN